MKNLSAPTLVLIFLVLIISGCTTQVVQVTEKGLEIETFEADFSNVYSGEQVDFRMIIRNTGSADSPEVFAEVLGIDQEWGPNPGVEVLPNEDECRYTSSEHFSLLAPDTISGTPGASHQCTWTYIAPVLPAGQSMTYEVTGRVFYRYSSATITSVTFGSYDEIKQLQSSGQSLPAETTSSSKGPIKIEIQTQGPVRFSENEGEAEFPLYITVKNLGGGVVCNTEKPNDCSMHSDVDYRNKIDITLSASNIDLADCEKKALSVFTGSYNSYSCEATATDLKDQPLTQRTITASADYSYYSDKEITVIVTGD